MSPDGLLQLSSGLSSNTCLTDFFFTHNDLQAAGDAGLEFIKTLSNKSQLKSLALNSCNLNGELLEGLQKSIENHS